MDDSALLQRLHPGLQSHVAEHWRGFTAIQREAIPILLDGRDCVIEAPTAGGKTEAVVFPALTRAAESSEEGVRVLYIAPLRALLNDLELRVAPYAELCGLHAFKWHGDVSQREKVDHLQLPPDVLLTTPESLEALLLRKAEWRQFLAGLQTVIIDEAHAFALGDRGHHLVSLLERVEHGVERQPQRVALTATIGNPDQMLVWLAGKRRTPGQRVHVTAPPPPRDFQVKLYAESEEDEAGLPAAHRRFLDLQRILPGQKGLVFAPSRKGAEGLSRAFAKTAVPGRPAPKVRTHHSAVSRFFREEAERLIRVASESGVDAIISTSTLELGIDIGQLDHVVQLDALASPAALLQRVGRTGRRPGRPQRLRGLCLDPKDLLLLTATVNLALRGETEALPFRRRAFHILAHQLLALSLQHSGISAKHAWELLSSAHSFSEVTEDEYEWLVRHMVDHDWLRTHGPLLLAGTEAERRFMGSGWRRLFAVFDSAPLYEVYDGQTQVGTLDAAFVEVLEVPFNFVLAGRLWTAKAVDIKGRKVRASPARDADAPKWSTFGGIDVPLETAEEVGTLLVGDRVPDFLDDEAAAALEGLRWEWSHVGWHPGEVLVREREADVQIVTLLGDRLNRTLAKLLGARGVGRAVADYQTVRVRPIGRPSAGEVLEAVTNVLQSLRSAEGVELERELAETLRPYPFSPFAQCLPAALAQAALVESRLDCPGLVRLARGRAFRIQPKTARPPPAMAH